MPLRSKILRGESVLRDEGGDGGSRPVPARNVLCEPLEMCSFKPMTEFYRDGCCNTGREDVGSHTVCAVMTAEFLAFSKSRSMIFLLPCQSSASPGSNQVIVGACVPRVGRKHSKSTKCHAWSCARHMRVRWLTARSLTSSGSRWIWRNWPLNTRHVLERHPEHGALVRG